MNIAPTNAKRSSSRIATGPDQVTSGRYRHKVALLSNRFRPAKGTLLRGRARLYGDRIELEGWRITGRFKQSLPLVRIIEMNYHPLDTTGNLSLLLDDGAELNLAVEEAHLWRQAFESWLNYHVLASAKILPERDQASAIAG